MAKGRYEKWLKKENLELIAAWCRDGYNDEAIAAMMGINPRTLYKWKQKYGQIEQAMLINKNLADARVEKALYDRALGVKVHKVTHEITIDPKTGKRTVKTYETDEEIPPDYRSISFWLRNRRPETWRDKQEVEVKGDVSISTALEAARERVKNLESDD